MNKFRLLSLILGSSLLASCSEGSNDSLQNDAPLVNVSYLLNGASSGLFDSYWQCNTYLNGGQESLVFQAFSDNTGRSSAIGDFTWTPMTDNIQLTSGSNSSTIYDMLYDPAQDMVFFKEFYSASAIRSYSCNRQSL